MTAQNVYTFPQSENPSHLLKPALDKTIPLDAIELNGATKRLPTNAFFQMQTPVTLLLVDTNTELTVQLVDRILIGRCDFESRDKLDIDLMDYRGREQGVSRLHAALHRTTHMLTIVDLKSANGTYVNGCRVVPEQPRFLQNGDEICLGKLLCHIHFTYQNACR
jgi:hypothetical protein